MIRSTPTGSSLDALIKTLQELQSHGFGESRVVVFDPDTEEWERVTSLTYGEGEIRIYNEDEEPTHG